MIAQRPAPPRGESGSLAVVQATWLVVLVVLGGLAAIDVGALLRGARVAAAAADGAALAAATASRGSSPLSPRVAADRIASAHGARLDTCECGAGRPATVAVTLPVDTRLLVHLDLVEVRARATARLVPRPADPDPPSADPDPRLADPDLRPADPDPRPADPDP